MASFTDQGMPTHQELAVHIIRALQEMGGSGSSRDLVTRVTEGYPNSELLSEVTYPNRPSVSVLEDRASWGRATAKRVGALEQPSRGMNLITDLGEELSKLDPEAALQRIKEIDRQVAREINAAKALQKKENSQSEPTENLENSNDVTGSADASEEDGIADWREQLLNRLHRMSPEGFEKFVIYLLKQYDLKLTHVGGSGDEGIDAIGTAPLSPVLSSRVAVQVKRYRPDGKAIGRETVALFQRDAMTRGAERAILVTLSRFTESARKAATDASPTVDLIGGNQLTDLVLESGNSGVKLAPVVNEKWFDRFD